MAKIDFGECHRRSIASGFRLGIHSIHKHAHPLLTGAMHVDRSTRFASGLDLHALASGLDRVVGIYPLHQQIGMPIVISVLGENARVLGKAGRQHVGQDAGHDGGAQHVVEPLKASFREVRIDVEKEVVNVLERNLKILESKLKRQVNVSIEARGIHYVSFYRHLRCPALLPACGERGARTQALQDDQSRPMDHPSSLLSARWHD